MPRKYIRKTTRQNWSETSMQLALDAVKDGMAFKKASRQFSVPIMALKRRTKGKNKLAVGAVKVLGSKQTVFTTEQEAELVKHIKDMETRMYGLTKTDILSLAYQLAEKNKMKHPFSFKKEKAGIEWLKGFRKRHPDITLRAPETPPAARAIIKQKTKTQDAESNDALDFNSIPVQGKKKLLLQKPFVLPVVIKESINSTSDAEFLTEFVWKEETDTFDIKLELESDVDDDEPVPSKRTRESDTFNISPTKPTSYVIKQKTKTRDAETNNTLNLNSIPVQVHVVKKDAVNSTSDAEFSTEFVLKEETDTFDIKLELESDVDDDEPVPSKRTRESDSFNISPTKPTSYNTAQQELAVEIMTDGIKSASTSCDEINYLDKAVQAEGEFCRCWIFRRDVATSPIREFTSVSSTQTDYSSSNDLPTNFTGTVKQESFDIKLENEETPDELYGDLENEETTDELYEELENPEGENDYDVPAPKNTRNRGNPNEIRPSSLTIQPRCQCIRRHFHCRDISEETRQKLFNHFWGLETWGDRKAFICKYVDAGSVKRQRSKATTSRRKLSFHYFFPVNGKPEKVCKQFFINTLCVRPLVVLNWAESVLMY